MKNKFNLKIDTSINILKNKKYTPVKCVKFLSRSNSEEKKHRISIIKIKSKKK